MSAIIVLLAICKPCIRFQRSLYRFRPKSTNLSSGALALPSWGLVQSFPSGARICIAYYIPHIMPCFASCCLRIAPWLIVVPLLVLLLWIEPRDEFVNEDPVEYVYEEQAFDNSENLAANQRFASCSFYCHAALPTTCLSCLPNCHAKPLTHHVLANHCLAMLPLCSAPLIVLLVAGEDWSLFLVGTCLLLGYNHIILFILMHLYTW